MGYKPYGEYKDSGVEWIGEIPSDWNVFKLKHVVNEFITGGTPKSSNADFWDENNEGIPWIAISDMTDNDFIDFTAKSLTSEGLANKNLRILKKGTLIYSIFASLGKVSILNIPATTNQAILGLITSNKIDKFYLKYYLDALREHIISFSNANTQDNLNSTTVKNIDIILPPSINNQKEIVTFLVKKTSEINENISKNKELISLLEERKTAIINQVVTKGLNPNVPIKDSGIEWIGEIPEHWHYPKLKFYANIINQKKESATEEDRYVGLEHIQSKTGKLLGFSRGGSDGSVNEFKKDMVLFGKLRPYLAKALYASFDGVCSTEILVFSTNANLLPKFLFYTFLSNKFIEKVNSSTYGVKMPRASPDYIKNLNITLPTIEEQSDIIEFLDREISNIDLVIEKIQYEIELLQEYKSSLIHHVVTGKIDVREEEI